MTHSVYMAYSDHGNLLYIGCAADVSMRLYQHERTADWIGDLGFLVEREYPVRERALAVEARAIRMLRPKHNVFAQRDQKQRFNSRLSDRGRQSMVNGGERFGRAHSIRDHPKRLALLNELDAQGKLRGANGKVLIFAQTLADMLNAVDPKTAPINNPETIRRWWREGFEGLDKMESE